MPQSEQFGKYVSAAFAKRNRAICPDREVGESQGEQEPHLGEREEERMDSTVKKGRFPGGKACKENLQSWYYFKFG